MKKRHAFPLFLAISFALYANSFSGDFVFDDLSTFRGRSVRAKSTWELVDSYRPIRYVSYRIDEAILGEEPWAYHVFNTLYHGIASCVVFLVLRRLAPGAALAGGLLFVTHPVHTECVAYLSGRRDILSTLFYLLGFLSWLELNRTRKWPWAAAFLACFGLAFFSKEMAITLPVVCLLHYVLLDPAFTRRRLGLYAAAGAFLAVPAAVYALQSSATTQQWHGGTMTSNFATSARLVPHYAGLLVFPLRLLGDHSYDAFPLSASFAEPRVLLSLLGIAAAVGAALWARRRAPLVAFGIGWFLVSLLPVLHIRPFHEIAAEHYLYLPSVGFCLLAGLGLERLRGFAGARAAWAALVLVLVAFSVRTVVRNRDWRDSETFWRATLKTAPRCARAHFNLGTVHARRSEWEPAAALMERASEIRPDYLAALYTLGKVYKNLGRDADAQAQFERALRVARAQKHPPVAPGDLCFILGRVDEAAEAYEAQVRQGVRVGMGLNGLKTCHRILGDRQRAAAARETDAGRRDGQLRKARGHYRRGLAACESLLLGKLRDNAKLLREAAELADLAGDRDRAEELRRRAARLPPPGR